jgi:hypothetical protein
MAFTNAEQIAMRAIFGPLIAKRLTESTQADLDGFLSLLDPAVGTNTYVKGKIQDSKTALLAEQAQLTANANARSAQIDSQVAVLNGLLAKYP